MRNTLTLSNCLWMVASLCLLGCKPTAAGPEKPIGSPEVAEGAAPVSTNEQGLSSAEKERSNPVPSDDWKQFGDGKPYWPDKPVRDPPLTIKPMSYWDARAYIALTRDKQPAAIRQLLSGRRGDYFWRAPAAEQANLALLHYPSDLMSLPDGRKLLWNHVAKAGYTYIAVLYSKDRNVLAVGMINSHCGPKECGDTRLTVFTRGGAGIGGRVDPFVQWVAFLQDEGRAPLGMAPIEVIRLK